MPRLFLLLVLGGCSTAMAAPPVEVRPPRTDSFGDPLPIGAVARLGTLRWKGRPQMMGLVFSADGKLVAACGGDNHIRVWNFPSGILLKDYGHNAVDPVAALTFSADQKRLILSGQNTLNPRFFDLATGNISFVGPVRRNDLAGGTVVSQNGRWAMCYEGIHVGYQISAIDLTRPQVRRNIGIIRIRGQSGGDLAAISPDGRWAAISLMENNVNVAFSSVHLFDTATGKSLSSPLFIRAGQLSLLFSPDGKSLVVGGESQLFRWEIKPPKGDANPEVKLACNYVCANDSERGGDRLAYSPNGKYLVSGGENGRVVLWDAATGKPKRVWPTSSISGICSVAISPDSMTLITTSDQDASVRLFDIGTGRELSPRCGHRGAISDLAFHPSGKSLASSSAVDGSIRTWDLMPKRTPIVSTRSVAFVEDRIRGREYAVIEHEGEAYQDIAFANKGRLLFGGLPNGRIAIWETSKHSSSRTLMEDSVRGRRAFAVSPDGKVLAVAPQENGLRLFKAPTGDQLRNPPAPDEPLDAMFFSPDGKVLGAATATGRFHSWDVATGRERKATLPKTQGVAQRYFHSVIDAEQIAMIWDRDTGRLVRQIYGVGRPSDLSPDGRYLASHREMNLTLREVVTGKIVREWRMADPARVVRFSPDGSLLAAGYADGTILLWDARPPLGKPLTAESAAKLWPELAGDNAFAARGTLIASPTETVALLKERLKPTPALDPARLSRLLAELDHPRYANREKATRELETLADRIEVALIGTLPRANAEMTQRIERILNSIRLNLPKGDQLRALRSVEILERIGTPEARELLAKIANSEGALGRESRDALKRLQER